MATFTETDVRASFTVHRDGAGAVRIVAEAESLDAQGQRIRSIGLDITDQLSAARVTGATELLDDIEARVQALWEIP